MDILKEYTLDGEFKEHLRFFVSCRMANFYFPCHPEGSEGSHFLTFFEKREKEETLNRLQNDIMDNTIVILSTKTEVSLN